MSMYFYGKFRKKTVLYVKIMQEIDGGFVYFFVFFKMGRCGSIWHDIKG